MFDVVVGRLTEWQIEQTTTYRGRADQCFFNQYVIIYMLIWISHYYWKNLMLMMESSIFPWFDRTPCPTRPPIQSVSSTLKKHLWWRHYWKEHSSPLVTFGDPVLISPNLEAVSVVMFYKDPLVWSGSLRSILVSMLFWWSSPISRVDRGLRGGGLMVLVCGDSHVEDGGWRKRWSIVVPWREVRRSCREQFVQMNKTKFRI